LNPHPLPSVLRKAGRLRNSAPSLTDRPPLENQVVNVPRLPDKVDARTQPAQNSQGQPDKN